MPPAVPSARTQRKAQVVQWIAYLLVAVFLGLLWYPAAAFLTSGAVAGIDVVSNSIWVIVTGFLVGGTFRVVSIRRGKEPSLWFAALFPLFATLSRSLTLVAIGARFDFTDNVVHEFLITTLYGYTCLGAFIIPVAFAHVAALRWAHRFSHEWSLRANWQSANRGAYLVACMLLMGGVEGVRYVRNQVETGQRFARRFGLEVPVNTTIAGRSDLPGSRTRTYWLRVDRNLAWPPPGVKNPMPLSHPEDELTIAERARASANFDPRTGDMDVRSVKWSHDDRLVQANLVRVGAVDYIEVIPW